MAAPEPSPLFEARGLRKVYGAGPAAVEAPHDVTLSLAAGEFVVILGPSGSGKSTLLNILGGLDAPTAGSVRFRDHVLTGASEAALTAYRREHVGFVFQFYNLIPALTAEENVALVTGLAGGSPHAASRAPLAAREALRLVGLEARARASSTTAPLTRPSTAATPGTAPSAASTLRGARRTVTHTSAKRVSR